MADVKPLRAMPLLACLACQATSAPAPPRAAVTDGMVDVGGRSLHIHCAGHGAPVVVFDAGLGNDGSAWASVQPEVARFTQACAYDRAGRGYSDPAPKPRPSRLMAADLHELLARAGVAGPYVLVGHSLGGLNVRLYAAEHPDDVAGMVLVDATSEDQDRVFDLLPPGKADFTAGVRDPEMDLATFRESLAEVRDLPAGAGRPLGDKPLVVLTHGKEPPRPDWLPEDVYTRCVRLLRELQARLTILSSNSAQVVADDSGHAIPQDAPERVVDAVGAAVAAVRSQGRVSTTKLAGVWIPVARGGLVTVSVERALYEKPGSAHFFVCVRVTNEAPAEIGVDLRSAHEVFYPNQWGTAPRDHREVIDEGRLVLPPFDAARAASVTGAYRAGALTRIPRGGALTYYVEFNASGPRDVDAQVKSWPWLIVSMDGQLRATDGARAERVTPPEDDGAREVAMRAPVVWKQVPPGAVVLGD
jgi:pimeloyl-ACP methyl ester carboxylesterase